MNEMPFIIEQILNAPTELVWKAISEDQHMKQWYFDLPGFKAEVGYTFEFFGGADPDNPYRHLCEVIEVIPGKKLSYSWRYDGYPGISLVTFELFPEGNKTKIKLTHAGLDTFPKIPDFAKSNFVAGWTDLITNLLKNYVENV